MTPELWKQVDELLEAALELPPEKREQFVAEACDGNGELRDEVLSLVKAQSRAADFMERSAMKVAAQMLAQDASLRNQVSLVGQEIGTYQIESLLGVGGMGEVYLARETKLNRRVALKILPAHFVADAERANRFEREAQALSALNHPNLITIFEVGELNGLHFIAMEFVEGQTLRGMMSGALRLRDVLSIVAQVAEALSAAHQSGIIHRDIKPDNIMVRADGYVKVLDFGLAKLTEPDVVPGGSGAAPTQAGATMGTLAYMSPEQATGETIDHRTDIWSLGVVLYELVTKEKPFQGSTRQATMNAILSSEPDSTAASDPHLPSELDLVLDKALEKDRELRYQTASDFRADVRRLLRAIDSAPSNLHRRAVLRLTREQVSRAWFWPAVVALAISLTLAGLMFFKSGAKPPDWTRATNIQLTDLAGIEFFPSLSPDGKSFVYAAKVNGNLDLFVLRVGGKNPTLLTKDSPTNDSQPAFSPDGERIAFRSEREPAGIYLMEATGENPRRITEGGFHPSWSPDGKEIVFSSVGKDAPGLGNSRPSSLSIVNLETGSKRLLTNGDAMQPSWSPGGNRIAFWFIRPASGHSDVATISKAGGEPVVVTTDGTTNWNPIWSPDGKFLYFASDRGGNMSFWRVAIDEETGKLLAAPEAVVTPSRYSRHLNFSRDGKRMIYVQTDDQQNIMGVGFDAKTERLTGEPFWITRGDRQLILPELSPDQKRFVMRVPGRNQEDIMVVDRDGTNWRNLTSDKFYDRYPRWSPDSKTIVFNSDRGGQNEIWMIDTDGGNLRQISFNNQRTGFTIWSPDGNRLLFRLGLTATGIVDLHKSWSEQTPQLLPAVDDKGSYFVAWDWSPDGTKVAGTIGPQNHSLSYFSFETNRYERVVNVNAEPHWLPDSRRLLYASEGKAFIVDIVTKKVKELLSREREQIRSIAASRDSQLLYFTVRSSESDIWLLDLE